MLEISMNEENYLLFFTDTGADLSIIKGK